MNLLPKLTARPSRSWWDSPALFERERGGDGDGLAWKPVPRFLAQNAARTFGMRALPLLCTLAHYVRYFDHKPTPRLGLYDATFSHWPCHRRGKDRRGQPPSSHATSFLFWPGTTTSTSHYGPHVNCGTSHGKDSNTRTRWQEDRHTNHEPSDITTRPKAQSRPVA